MADDPPQEWINEVRREVFDKLRDSALSITVWSGAVDWKIALETGAAVLLDKPIILCVTPGCKVPNNLVKIATAIVEVDVDTDKGQAAVVDAIEAVLRELP